MVSLVKGRMSSLIEKGRYILGLREPHQVRIRLVQDLCMTCAISDERHNYRRSEGELSCNLLSYYN